jgi:hypothetical protein
MWTCIRNRAATVRERSRIDWDVPSGQVELSQNSLEARMFPDRIEQEVKLSENQRVFSIAACLFQIG